MRDAVLAVAAGETTDKLVARARGFEHDADRLVTDCWETTQRRPDYAPVFPLLQAADDAADELEEGAFFLGLLTRSQPSDGMLDPLQSLADLLVQTAQEWVKALT